MEVLGIPLIHWNSTQAPMTVEVDLTEFLRYQKSTGTLHFWKQTLSLNEIVRSKSN